MIGVVSAHLNLGVAEERLEPVDWQGADERYWTTYTTFGPCSCRTYVVPPHEYWVTPPTTTVTQPEGSAVV